MVGCILAGINCCVAAEMKVDIDTTQLSRHLLHSRIQLPAKPGSFSFRHPEWIPGIHGPSEQIRNIGGLTVTGANGERLEWRRDAEQLTLFTVEVPESSDHVVVELTYIANQPTRVSTGVDSYGNADVLAINMNTCIVYPDGVDLRSLPVDVSVTLPPDYRFATALRDANQVGDNKFQFEETTVETLVDSPLIAGRNYRRLDVSVAGFPETRYHFVSESADALEFDDEWATGYQRLMDEAFQLFGGAPFSAYDFLVVCSDTLPGMGLEHHESSLNGIDEEALVKEDKKKGRAVYLLAHELVHAWCGKYRRPAGMYRADYHTPKKTSELWIYEGLTQYLGQVLTARAGFLTFDEHLERTAARIGYLANRAGRAWRPLEDTAIAAYTLRGGSPSWTDLRRSQDYYDEGAFFWLEADSIIRTQSNNEKSLDDFCRRFFAADENFPKVKPFEMAEVISILDELADFDWAGLIERRIRTAAPDLSLEGIRTAGYEFDLVAEKPAYVGSRESSSNSIAAQFSLGLLLKNSGEISAVIPNSVADKANLADGMNIFGVNGMKFDAKRLTKALQECASKDSDTFGVIELLVEFGDAYRVVELAYDGGPKYPALIAMEGQPDLFRAICSPVTWSADPAADSEESSTAE